MKKKGKLGIGAIVLVILGVIAMESCFASSALPEEVSSNEAEIEETTKTSTEGAEKPVDTSAETVEKEEPTQSLIIPGATWYREEEDVIKYININIDDASGCADVQGFVTDYNGTLLDEYGFEKIFYIEEFGYTSEDGNMDIDTNYMQVTDYGTSFYDGYYALVEETGSTLLSFEELNAFIRDETNVGKTISFYAKFDYENDNNFYLLAYEPTFTQGTISFVTTKCDVEGVILSGQSNDVLVTGTYDGIYQGTVLMTLESMVVQ